jgi:hypothetical protein
MQRPELLTVNAMIPRARKRRNPAIRRSGIRSMYPVAQDVCDIDATRTIDKLYPIGSVCRKILTIGRSQLIVMRRGGISQNPENGGGYSTRPTTPVSAPGTSSVAMK